jgi:glycosyltransferase involved in cell wall biosynthesis
MNSETFPAVSVIIPCRNERNFIGACVDSILASDYPADRLEVLVVDGMSTDGTPAVVDGIHARDSRVRLVPNPKFITAAAFNTGIRESKGQVVMILGAHSEIGRDYVSLCVDALSRLGADNVGGVLKTIPRDNTVLGRAIVRALSHPFGVGNARFRSGASEPVEVDTVFGGCYRREALERTGPFNEKLTFSQDMEFNIRFRKAGGKIMLVPGIETTYYARTSLWSFLRHNWRNGEWVILPFAFSTVIPVSPRHLIPLAFVLSLPGSLALSALWNPAIWLFAIIAGSYGLLAVAAAAQITAREKDARYLIVMPFMFAGLHINYGLGSLWGALRTAVILAKRRGVRG